MKCQNLFRGKNKQNTINLLSAELAPRAVKVKLEEKQMFQQKVLQSGHCT